MIMEDNSKDNQTILFGFIGQKGSGKDTAARLLLDIFKKFKDPCTISASVAFADPLKKMANATLGITEDESEFLKRHPNIKVANNLDIRSYYNQFGDTLKSNFGKTIFTDMAINTINDIHNNIKPNTIMVTDVRLPMEVDALQKYGKRADVNVILIKMINTSAPLIIPVGSIPHETEYLAIEMKGDYEIVASNPQEIEEQLQTIYNSVI